MAQSHYYEKMIHSMTSINDESRPPTVWTINIFV